MRRVAIYGKGGIGKSTIVSNLSATMAMRGKTVMQIGCDPKADSTINLRRGESLPTVLDTVRKKKNDFALDEVVKVAPSGVVCVEAGGPIPGLGCAGRGIITALEKLNEKEAYDIYQPDILLYDVLGDVVCGGFSMPMRVGYAQDVYIVTSGENMSIYAAANIATAVRNFKGRGYASLGGFILNRRNVKNELEKVEELVQEFDSRIVGVIDHCEEIPEAEERKMTACEAFPESEAARQFQILADAIFGE